MDARISLCLIVGNESGYIERCLESFLPVADEVVVVRAVGGLAPDDTLERAAAVCRRHGVGLVTGEYRNRAEHADWPHVDDFAAARQLSFDLASGGWAFWCDADDVLEVEGSLGRGAGEVARELAGRGDYAAVVMPYRIFGRGISVPRERLVRRDAGRWRYPVHECFAFVVEPLQAVEDNRLVVVHRPALGKRGSCERNLRILRSIPAESLTTGLRYHLQQELGIAGDVAGSVALARELARAPDLGRPERYELFLSLAQLAEDLEVKRQFLHQAYAADPRRREALGLLVGNALDAGRGEEALAYARQMRATAGPGAREWNDRGPVYGWLGEEIYTHALRGAGEWVEAERVRQGMLAAAGGPRVALVHATRGRPQQAAVARKVWLDFAARPDRVEHVFVMDADDAASEPLRRMHHLVLPAGGGCVAAWNAGCALTRAPVLVQLSDDWVPCPMWDDLICARLGDVNLPRVLAVSDGVREDGLLCMAICTRAYWEQDWFLFHPDFTGVWSDNWFTELAYRRGAVVEARDIRFAHEHPVKTGRPLDETYARQNAPERYAEGEEVYRRLRGGGDWSEVPGFYNFWPLYREVAGRLRDGDVVCEVGVWLGRSVIHLAQMLRRAGKRVRILAVDHFRGEKDQPAHAAVVAAAGGNFRGEFEANLERCGVREMVEILEGESAEMALRVADGSLAFCFIDAAHDYESVSQDLAAWGPKVREGGILAGHDAQHEPVLRAVRERYPGALVLGPVWLREGLG